MNSKSSRIFLEQLQAIHFPNLLSLTTAERFTFVKSVEKEQTALEDLIRRHCCHLQTLKIGPGTHLRMQVIWDVEAERKNTKSEDERTLRQQQQPLRVLCFDNQVLDMQELGMNQSAGWDLLRGLETLSLIETTWSFTEDEEVIEQFPSLLLGDPFSNLKGNRIQSRTLRTYKPISANLYFLIITHCQQLRSLTWVQGGFDHRSHWKNVWPQFAKGLAEGLWPYLDTLELDLTYEEDDYAEVIENLGHHYPLKSLKVDNSVFGPKSLQALLNAQGGRHRASLEELSVRNCRQMKGILVHQIMCSFPNLLSLHAPYITELDVLQDPRPWVCLELKVLKLCLYVPILGADMDTVTDTNTGSPLISSVCRTALLSAMRRPSTVLLDRIATLTRLESLNVASRDIVVPAPVSNTRPLPDDLWTYPLIQLDDDVAADSDCPTDDVSRKGDLTQLGTPKWLRLFVPTSSGHIWTMREVQWMVKNWPWLNSLDCSSRNQMPAKELYEFLEQHRIEDDCDFRFD